jgi:hypothetical protein
VESAGSSAVHAVESGGSSAVHAVESGGSSAVHSVESGGSSALGSVGSAASALEQRTKSTVSSVTETIAAKAKGPLGSAAQYLDITGAAAEVLINNSDVAIVRPVEHFVANTISTAQQLAVDASKGLTVLAMVVENGTTILVKTAIADVESAAMVTGAFFQRVGLEIKAVIDFLAALFDWDAILKLQATLQKTIDDRVAAFPGRISAQRAQLSDRFKSLETTLASLGSEGNSPGQISSPAPADASGIGGQFGWLLDKIESYLFGNLGLSPDLGLSAILSLLPLPTGPVATGLSDFLVKFTNSAVAALVTEPKKIFSQDPHALLQLFAPLLVDAVKSMADLVDQVLAIAPTLITEAHKVLAQRISIPYLTDLIELVVFHKQQQLSLESLLTLVAAALLTVMDSLLQVASGKAMSFSEPESFDDSQPSPNWTNLNMMIVAAIFNLFQSMLSAGSLITESKEAIKIMGAVSSLLDFISAALAVPYPVPDNSFLIGEQWVNWTFNLVAGLLQLINGVRQAVMGDDGNKSLAIGSAVCAAGMIITVMAADPAAINLGKGDRNLAGFDLVAQLASSLNNLVPITPDGAQPAIGSVANLTSFGIGIKQAQYCVANPSANLG